MNKYEVMFGDGQSAIIEANNFIIDSQFEESDILKFIVVEEAMKKHEIVAAFKNWDNVIKINNSEV